MRSALLSGSGEGQLQNMALALVAAACDVAGPHMIRAHSHPRGQLLYAATGTMRVGLDSRTWVITPQQGVWVPPHREHQVQCDGPMAYRSVYVHPASAHLLPAAAIPIVVPRLLRELILEAASFGTDYRPDTAEGRLLRVLYDRLQRMRADALAYCLPRDRRLRRVAESVLSDPGDNRTMDGWAGLGGTSVRTLTRGFARETGLAFGAWRQRARLAYALQRLTAGDSVTAVALDLGYATPSAFTAMFRRTMGQPPGRYLPHRRGL